MMQPLISFERAVHYYDETRGFPPGIAEQVARGAARWLTPETRVLEIGIGTGRIAKPLVALGYKIFGLHVSLRMMQRLRATLPPDIPEPHLALGDAARLPWLAGSFNAILAVHVFHLIPQWQDALREITRALEPGGILLHGTDWRPPETPSNRVRSHWNEILLSHGFANRNRPKPEKIHETLADAGAEMTEAIAARWEESFKINQYIDHLAQGMYSSVWHVPPERLPEYLDELRTWARHEFGNLEQEFICPHTFTWQNFSWKGPART